MGPPCPRDLRWRKGRPGRSSSAPSLLRGRIPPAAPGPSPRCGGTSHLCSLESGSLRRVLAVRRLEPVCGQAQAQDETSTTFKLGASFGGAFCRTKQKPFRFLGFLGVKATIGFFDPPQKGRLPRRHCSCTPARPAPSSRRSSARRDPVPNDKAPATQELIDLAKKGFSTDHVPSRHSRVLIHGATHTSGSAGTAPGTAPAPG